MCTAASEAGFVGYSVALMSSLNNGVGIVDVMPGEVDLLNRGCLSTKTGKHDYEAFANLLAQGADGAERGRSNADGVTGIPSSFSAQPWPRRSSSSPTPTSPCALRTSTSSTPTARCAASTQPT